MEVGRDPWRSCGPELVAEDHFQVAFEHLQGWTLHDLPGQPVPVLSHPQGEKVFPNVQTDPPVPLVLALGTPEKSLAPAPWHRPFT